MFPEALLLHYMDDLDSKMESMRAHFLRESENESPWTSYNASLGRPLLNSSKFLSPKTTDATTPASGRQIVATVVQTETLTLSGLELTQAASETPIEVAQEQNKA